MPAKAPIYLKAGAGKNGYGNSKGGKKLRELLSTEMISPPLGDFRHMAHVGRGADDMFGDTTFLQNQTEIDKANDGTDMKRTSSLGRKGTNKSRNYSVPDENGRPADVKSVSAQSYDGYGPAESPILQSAFSLPLLPHGSESTDTSPVHSRGSIASKAKGKKTMNNNCITNGKSHSRSYGDGINTSPATTPNGTGNGPPKPRRIMDEEPNGLGSVDKHSELRRSSDVYTQKPGGMLGYNARLDTSSVLDGWNVDLGCSLMDDVMGVFDRVEL
ncbi:cdc42 effector protein 2 [Ciona intestinalis]